jgi:hypothetical protein
MAFLHHQWAYPQIFFMVLSIGGMLFYYWMISFWTFDSFYAATSVLYARPSFWLMGMFTAPLIMMVFEAIAYYGRLFFSPTKEMYYREVMNRVSADQEPGVFSQVNDDENNGLKSPDPKSPKQLNMPLLK